MTHADASAHGYAHGQVIRARSIHVAVLACVLACGDDQPPTGGSGSSSGDVTSGGPTDTGDPPTSTSMSTSSSGASSGDDTSSDFPSACEGLESPFVSADCLSGLRDRCRTADDENACDAIEPLYFEGGYAIDCGWAKVVTIADVAACTIDAVMGRCEAGIEQQIGCPDRCTETPDLYASLRANVADAELIEMPCTPTGRLLDGPLGPGSAVGAPPPKTGSTCAPNVQPPAPEICACSQAACAAE